MCYQITEYYSVCGCVYYLHAVDRCAAFDRPGHGVQKRKVLVGYACSSHTSYASSHLADEKTEGGGAGDVSDDEDRASVFSDISAPSTNVSFPDDAKQEAADRLFQELINEFSLRHLWPQIVRISHHKDQAVKNVARYLSRFSRDLRTDATTRLNKNAAGFVRTARLTIAHRIVECHINELTHVDDWAFITTAKEAPLDEMIESEETEDLDTDEKNIIYENVQQFIFEGAPFQSFILALRLFASSNTESAQEPGHDPRQYFNYLTQKYWKGPVTNDRTRLSWSCRCGHKGHDDYTETRAGAIDELQVLLGDYEKMTLELVENTGPASVKMNLLNLASSIRTSISRLFSKENSTKLPTYNQGARGPKSGETCHISSNTEVSALDPKHKFLMICAPFMRRVSKAHQPDVCKIHSDRDFFKALQCTYSDSRRALKSRWLRRVSSIDFVKVYNRTVIIASYGCANHTTKFEMFLSEIVNIQQCPSLPGSQARIEYDFEQCDTDPPIGPNLLSHLFENPDHAEVLPVLFNRIPKKMGQRLCACPRKGSSVGWGIRFVEGLDPFAVFLCGCIGFVVSLAVSLIYTLVMDDIQGGFAIGAHLLAFFLFSGGCLHHAFP